MHISAFPFSFLFSSCLVISAIISTKHINSRGFHLLLFNLLLLFFFSGIATAAAGSTAAAATTTTGTSGSSNQLSNFLGGEEVGEDNGVEGLDLGVAGGLEEGSDLTRGDLGLFCVVGMSVREASKWSLEKISEGQRQSATTTDRLESNTVRLTILSRFARQEGSRRTVQVQAASFSTSFSS